jgi:SHS2 domain-containing protein
MSEPFETLDHTADTGFRAWGSTVAELFENSARAMLALSADTSAVVEGKFRLSDPVEALRTG